MTCTHLTAALYIYLKITRVAHLLQWVPFRYITVYNAVEVLTFSVR